ncbi:hypothetical protein DYQ86_02380 [Acidobacteria bacterium AB60]|nr:hypothetical protein DYQ86_02380 [Acidobacteria bacterium AB60]
MPMYSAVVLKATAESRSPVRVLRQQGKLMSSVSALNSLLSSTSSSSSSSNAANLSSILAAVAGTSTPGIDVNAAVQAGIYAARGSERLWQSQQTGLGNQTTALKTLQTAVTNLDNDMQSLNSLVGPLSARTVTSSNAAAVSGSAASATALGNHTVVVDSLAQTASWYSDSVSSGTSALPAGSFTITPASGSALTVTVGSGVNTLSDVANFINNSAQNPGVTARVVTDTTGARLAIVSNSAGTAGNFTLSTSNSYPLTATSWSSASVADASTALPAGTFTLAGPSGTASLTVTSSDTLTTLAAGINGLGLGVTATVVTDSNGAHLSLADTDSSSTKTFTISRDPAASDMGFTQAVTGADAQLTVDGIPVTSASNTVKGAVGGLTLNLMNANPQSVINLSISPNTSQVASSINQFVSDYNTAIGQVNAQFVYSASNEPPLANDPTIRGLQNAMMQALSYVNSGSTNIATLGALGISMNNDGTLSVDTTTLDNSLQNDFGDVQTLFQGSSLNGFANSFDQALTSFLSPAHGAFTIDLQSINTQNNDLQKEIDDYETNVITPLQSQLQSDYSKAEIALQSLSQTMQRINAELGFNNNNSNGG